MQRGAATAVLDIDIDVALGSDFLQLGLEQHGLVLEDTELVMKALMLLSPTSCSCKYCN